MTREESGPAAAFDGPPWYVANEILAFLLELLAFGLLGWWGFATGSGTATRVLLGVGTPAAAIALWGLLAAPRARLRPSLPVVLLVKALVFGAAAAGLYGVGHPAAAVAVAGLTAANTAIAETTRRARPRG